MHHVRVDFGGLDVGMPHELLDRAEVDPIFQKMGGKEMAQGMAGGPFGDAGAINGGFDGLLQRILAIKRWSPW